MTQADIEIMPASSATAGHAIASLAAAASTTYATVGEMAYAVLREAILTGALENGATLRQESLAARLGISRVPVRDALKRLEADGLIDNAPRRGARVRVMSKAFVEQTFEARVLLETFALRRSMTMMNPERAGRLVELAMRLDASTAPGDFRALMLEFYHELYDAEGQAVLAALIDRLRDSVGREFVAQPMTPHDFSHRELALAVVAGEVDTAVEQLRGHLSAVESAILRRAS